MPMAADFDSDLQVLARGDSLDDAKWPTLLQEVLLRVDHIAHHQFPIPSVPNLNHIQPSSQPDTRSLVEASFDDERPLKKAKLDSEDAPASSPSTSTRDLKPPEEVKDSLPPPLVSLLQHVLLSLRANFPHSPPYTAQRVAELVLYPKQHYQTLPSYLRAFDRIVSVASSVSDFPLPSIASDGDKNNLFNGTLSNNENSGTEDRDFIGGAELTPIPWLRDAAGSPLSTDVTTSIHANGAATHLPNDLRTESTSVIDGPHGAGSIEVVSVNVGANHPLPSSTPSTSGTDNITKSATSLTQGELLRQEQEAGITPVPSPTVLAGEEEDEESRQAAQVAAAVRAVGLAPSISPDVMISETADQQKGETTEDEEIVHARGPKVIGMEDMGPQAPGSGLEHGVEVAGPLGRSEHVDDGVNATEGEREEEKDSGEGKEQASGGKDEDGDEGVGNEMEE